MEDLVIVAFSKSTYQAYVNFCKKQKWNAYACSQIFRKGRKLIKTVKIEDAKIYLNIFYSKFPKWKNYG